VRRVRARWHARALHERLAQHMSDRGRPHRSRRGHSSEKAQPTRSSLVARPVQCWKARSRSSGARTATLVITSGRARG
jgi:hypothetical protein